MKIFGFFSLFIWVFLLIILAVTFDWFNAREFARATVVFLDQGIDYLAFLGDELMEFFAEVQENGEDLQMPIEPKLPDNPSA